MENDLLLILCGEYNYTTLCQHCGTEVDCFATHGLNCRHSEGRIFRHAALNDIIMPRWAEPPAHTVVCSFVSLFVCPDGESRQPLITECW